MKKILNIIGIIIAAAFFLAGCAGTGAVKSDPEPGNEEMKIVKEERSASETGSKEEEILSIGGAPFQKDGEVIFTYTDPAAEEVFIAGDFNNWKKNTSPMKKNENGVYTAELKLEPGNYNYKFVVDGNWITDPDNPKTSSDGYGGVNSVVVVE